MFNIPLQAVKGEVPQVNVLALVLVVILHCASALEVKIPIKSKISKNLFISLDLVKIIDLGKNYSAKLPPYQHFTQVSRYLTEKLYKRHKNYTY